MEISKPHTIQTFVNAFDYRDTRNKPILAICDDGHTYVIKHNRSKKPSTILAIELVAYYFLKLWNIPTPEIALVTVLPEHIKGIENTDVREAFFALPCFGSRFYKDAMEFNNFFGNIQPYEKSKFSNKANFLRMALFDIWLKNDDFLFYK